MKRLAVLLLIVVCSPLIFWVAMRGRHRVKPSEEIPEIPHRPTTLASPTNVGRQLLVGDNGPGPRPIRYAYIMPEDQQRRVLREAPKLMVGDTVDLVVEKLGPPFDDRVGYGPKGSNSPKRHRRLLYYFAKRDFELVNEYDPNIHVFFDEKDRIEAIASEIADIPSVNWPPAPGR